MTSEIMWLSVCNQGFYNVIFDGPKRQRFTAFHHKSSISDHNMLIEGPFGKVSAIFNLSPLGVRQ